MLDCFAFSVTPRCIQMPCNHHLLMWVPREVPPSPPCGCSPIQMFKYCLGWLRVTGCLLLGPSLPASPTMELEMKQTLDSCPGTTEAFQVAPSLQPCLTVGDFIQVPGRTRWPDPVLAQVLTPTLPRAQERAPGPSWSVSIPLSCKAALCKAYSSCYLFYFTSILSPTATFLSLFVQSDWNSLYTQIGIFGCRGSLWEQIQSVPGFSYGTFGQSFLCPSQQFTSICANIFPMALTVDVQASFCVRHLPYEIWNLMTLLRRCDHLQFGGNWGTWHLQGTPIACAVLERRRSIPCRTLRTMPTLSHSVLSHIHLHTCVT